MNSVGSRPDLDQLRARLRAMDDRMLKAVGSRGRAPVLAGIELGCPAARGVCGPTSGSTGGMAAEASEEDLTSYACWDSVVEILGDA
jgi:hypothetical protein